MRPDQDTVGSRRAPYVLMIIGRAAAASGRPVATTAVT
jgi:hypothetical protein